MGFDIETHRLHKNYTRKEMLDRILWGSLGKALIRLSPRPCFSYRRLILRLFGAKIGKKVNIYPSTVIYFPWNLVVGDWSAIAEDVLVYNLGLVTIGQRVFVSHRAHLCAGTHDYTKSDFPLIKSRITIENDAWICSQAFIGPDVVIGHGSIVGACAVVLKSVPDWKIVAGNPAKIVKDRPKI